MYCSDSHNHRRDHSFQISNYCCMRGMYVCHPIYLLYQQKGMLIMFTVMDAGKVALKQTLPQIFLLKNFIVGVLLSMFIIPLYCG